MANVRPITNPQAQQIHVNSDVLIGGQGLILAEQASAPSTPPSGYGILYVKTDGLLYFKGDTGVETLLS